MNAPGPLDLVTNLSTSGIPLPVAKALNHLWKENPLPWISLTTEKVHLPNYHPSDVYGRQGQIQESIQNCLILSGAIFGASLKIGVDHGSGKVMNRPKESKAQIFLVRWKNGHVEISILEVHGGQKIL